MRTLKDLKRDIQRWDMSAVKKDGEVRIAFKGPSAQTEPSAYYGSADDLDDCYGTAKAMYCKKWGIPNAPFYGYFKQWHNGEEAYTNLTPEQRDERLREGRCPIGVRVVRSLEQLQVGDVIELLAQYQHHSAQIEITAIYPKHAVGVEIINSYRPGTNWMVKQSRLDDLMKATYFLIPFMKTERLIELGAQEAS